MSFFFTKSKQNNFLIDYNQTQQKRKSQIEQMIDKKAISVAIVDNKAYWVKENVFYVAPITE